MKVNCGVCGHEKDSIECEVIVLTPAEKRVLIDRGETPDDRYHYCKPCWRVMHSEHAPDLMANQVKHQMRQAGIPEADATKMADNYKTRLKEVGRKSRHGTQT